MSRIWLNGTISDNPKQISAFDKMNIGLTVFTTMLAVKDPDPRIIDGPEHYARLCNHARILMLAVPYTEEEILKASRDIIRTARGQFFAIRVQITAGEGIRGLMYPETPTVMITVAAVPDPSSLKPVRVKIEREIILYCGDIMNRIKSNYALRALARRKAAQDGFDDVLLMNEMNAITSASVGNIILRIENIYKTPPLKDGVLDGITRAKLIKSMNIRESSLSEMDFRYCDAAWIVNSLGIRPIIAIDDTQKPAERLI